MVVPVCFFVVALSYAVCVNFVPSYRDPADKTHDSSLGIISEPRDEEDIYRKADEVDEKTMESERTSRPISE